MFSLKLSFLLNLNLFHCMVLALSGEQSIFQTSLSVFIYSTVLQGFCLTQNQLQLFIFIVAICVLSKHI